MIVLSGALVLVALVLLVFGALDRNLPYVYASIGVSVLSLLLLLVGILQRRGELTGEEHDAAMPVTDTSAQRMPALVGAEQEQTAVPRRDAVTSELPLHTPEPEPARPVLRRIVPVEDARPGPVDDGDDEDEPVDVQDAEPEDVAPEDDELVDEEPGVAGSGVTVLVVSGRPRYHLEGCRVLRGKEPQPLDRDDARTHGFSPCGVCKPDAVEGEPPAREDVPAPVPPEPVDVAPTAPQDQVHAEPPQAVDDGPSFTEALFGEPLFADRPTELHGDDPADDVAGDPLLAPDDAVRAEPAPDVAGDPDEQVEQAPADEPVLEAVPVPDEQPAAQPVVEEPVVEEPVVEEPVVPVGEAVRPPEAAPADEPVAPEAREPAPTSAPAEQAPARTQAKAPAQKAPAKKAPAKKAPAKKAPAKRAPAKKAPAKAAPAAVAPAPEPPVKRPLVRAVRADALRLGAPSAGGTSTRVSARAAAPATAPPVVVVPDRDRFHRPDCRFVRGVAGATTLPKASASRQGYAACGACKP